MGFGDRPERPKPDAYQKALELLVRREHSRRDLRRKLGLRGADPEEAEAAIEKLAGLGYQDDLRFGTAFARDRAHSGYGPVRIRQELAGHGLPAEAVVQALDACETDWAGSARALIDKRFRPADLADPARRRKAVDFLLRRGFDQNAAYGAVRGRAGDVGGFGEPDEPGEL
ncbi:regulatory protein RecX [Arenimonas sp.]|uniref:regulatory protein RecX n=1 Tax=Arenimonas sp. TaxID=1872635 RepID=UPI0025C1A505|nr:regulatory protein RecX [Arenimonas sp.]